MDKTIEELEEHVRSCREALSKAEQALHQAKCDVAGIHVGDIVLDKKTCVDVLVTRVRVWTNSTWIDGRKRKKNGEWADRISHLYEAWAKKEES